MSFPKQGKVRSPEYLAWARSQPCPCGAPSTQAHHWPIRGRRQDVDDTKVIGVCVDCHERCHGKTVVRRGKRLYPITAEEQTAAVDATFRKFITEGDRDTVRSILKQLWREP